MSNLELLKERLSAYKSTLKNTSLDKENQLYLCESESEVYDFESFVQNDIRLKKRKTFDALLINDRQIFCIEFKNQKYSKIKNESIQGKYIDGLNTLEELLEELGLEKEIEDCSFFFFVVYRNPPNMTTYRDRGFENEIQFGLDKCKENNQERLIYKKTKIRTEPKRYFQKKYRHLVFVW